MQIKTIDAMVGMEELIINHFNLPPITGNRHYPGECPICSKRKKFRLHRYRDKVSYICVCGSGSLINLICERDGIEFKDACKEIDRIIGNDYKPPIKQQKQQEKIKPPRKEVLMNRFTAIHTLKGSNVEGYLKSRGIYQLPEMSVKYSHSEFDRAEGRSFECMYAVATDEQMNIVYTHKTYLDGPKKAECNVNKKMETVNKYNLPCESCGHEHAANVAVRMFPATDTLGISEGIESALSAHQLFGFPVWSVLNTSIMKEFKAPSGVSTLIIYADNDKNGAGLAAAFTCGHKNILSNNDISKVIIRTPSKIDCDFNDMLNEPMNTVDYTLHK
jgi:putative DNA primase/helicase